MGKFNLFCKLCKLLCFPPCPQNIIENCAFQPPAPTYNIHLNKESRECSFEFKEDSKNVFQFNIQLPMEDIDVSYPSTKCSTRIVCIYYSAYPSTAPSLLYSHGNGVDLGGVIGFIVWLARKIHCNVLAYDYSGYGRSTGKATEKRLYADIEAAYQLLLDKYDCKPENIILMGQSLGSAPTLHLASKKPVKGVVVQSGFASALNIAFPQEEHRTLCCDAFQNIDKVGKVMSPVLVIHGTDDDIIDVSHGQALYIKCPNTVEPLFVQGAGHNDIEGYSQFERRLFHFVHHELTTNKMKSEVLY